MEKIKVIIFDIDGVIVDVSNSYRVAIKKTAEFFLGKMLSMEDVEAVKNRGINNDWDATELLIQENGGDFRKDVIIKKFQEYYVGRKFDGLINQEKLLIDVDMIKKLSKKYLLAILTGRSKIEANFVLEKYGIKKYFKEMVAMENVKEGKPNPEGLLKLIKKIGLNKDSVVYVGDNIADLGAANNAEVKFVGVIPPSSDKEYLKNMFKSRDVKDILDSVNEIKSVLK